MMISLCSREELLGIPREGNPRDVDWAKEVPQVSTAVTTLPPPVKIDVAELLLKLPARKAENTEPKTTSSEGTSSPISNKLVAQ